MANFAPQCIFAPIFAAPGEFPKKVQPAVAGGNTVLFEGWHAYALLNRSRLSSCLVLDCCLSLSPAPQLTSPSLPLPAVMATALATFLRRR